MFPNNKKVIEEITKKIAKIQDKDYTEKGVKLVKELIEKLSMALKREEKYWL